MYFFVVAFGVVVVDAVAVFTVIVVDDDITEVTDIVVAIFY
jgi:hypothetical protein